MAEEDAWDLASEDPRAASAHAAGKGGGQPVHPGSGDDAAGGSSAVAVMSTARRGRQDPKELKAIFRVALQCDEMIGVRWVVYEHVLNAMIELLRHLVNLLALI